MRFLNQTLSIYLLFHGKYYFFQIRLNGQPISESEFSSYFWRVYDKVCLGYADRPAYFKFLTILAFNIFLEQKVDVAIIEGKFT